MVKHLQREIAKLKRHILSLSTYVEESVQKALKSFEEQNLELANEVIVSDRRIDLMEVEVEEECLKILALHQPVATDLRFIVSVLKINNDLERIGDLAVNIAHQTELMVRDKHPSYHVDFDLPGMAKKSQSMLKNALDAFVTLNVKQAQKVCNSDDEVDEINQKIHAITERESQRNPEAVGICLHYLKVSTNLERIADLATNIAEDIIYMVNGEIVRHKLKERLSNFS